MLKELIGRKVHLWSRAGDAEFRDEGVLENFDDTFLLLRKGEERLFFVVANIRLIKSAE